MVTTVVNPKKRVKTPMLMQMEAVECGAASLGIILGYHGQVVPLTDLRQTCGVSRDGSKASRIIKAARSYGLKADGYKKEIDQVKDLPCPYIAFWNFNHFLVVEGHTKNKVYLNDPATGPRSITLEEFDESYTGVALTFSPGPDFKKGGARRSVAAALWQRLKSSLPALAYCVMAGILLVVPGLATPVFIQVFVDDVLIGGSQDWLRPLLLLMALTAAYVWVVKQLQLLFLRRLKLKLAIGMSGRFLWHALRLPISYYAQRFAGEIASRVGLNDNVADVLSGKLATTAIGVVTMVFYGVLMFAYDPVLTMVGVTFAGVNFAILRAESRRRIDGNIRLGMEFGKTIGVSINGLQTIETLKASGLEGDFFARWSGHYAKSLNTLHELSAQNRTVNVIPPLLSALTTATLLIVGGIRVMHGELSLGMLIAFQALMLSFLRPVNDLLELGDTLQALVGDLDRLDDLLENTMAPGLTSEDAAAPPTCRLAGAVELRAVTFGYSPTEPPLIENLSFQLKPGQRIALVGGSGSGKTTVAKLMSGLFEPWSGTICFDGAPRSELARSTLINSLAVVDQEVFMFAGTVRENLTLWDSTVADGDLIQACKDAAIHEVILGLPGGYDAMLTEGGTNLSGGQRQRLEIARALIGNPSVLVLDEATSALDSNTEQLIDQNLRRRGCTCIIVAHRLSTIRDCDEILVFDKGKVVQRGTHDQLWQAGGAYARLLRSEGGILNHNP